MNSKDIIFKLCLYENRFISVKKERGVEFHSFGNYIKVSSANFHGKQFVFATKESKIKSCYLMKNEALKVSVNLLNWTIRFFVSSNEQNKVEMNGKISWNQQIKSWNERKKSVCHWTHFLCRHLYSLLSVVVIYFVCLPIFIFLSFVLFILCSSFMSFSCFILLIYSLCVYIIVSFLLFVVILFCLFLFLDFISVSCLYFCSYFFFLLLYSDVSLGILDLCVTFSNFIYKSIYISLLLSFKFFVISCILTLFCFLIFFAFLWFIKYVFSS